MRTARALIDLAVIAASLYVFIKLADFVVSGAFPGTL
jgi:hypothetical protein